METSLPFLAYLHFWHWIVLAALLATVEILAPGFFFIWLAGAALLTGLILFAGSLFGLLPGGDVQLVVFAALAVASVFLWQRFHHRGMRRAKNTLNRRGSQMIGRTFTLSEPIVNGRGVIRADDTVWKVEGADLPAGNQVTVTGIEGTILKVKATAQ